MSPSAKTLRSLVGVQTTFTTGRNSGVRAWVHGGAEIAELDIAKPDNAAPSSKGGHRKMNIIILRIAACT